MKGRNQTFVIALFWCFVFSVLAPRTTSTSILQIGHITVSGHYEYWDNNGILRPTVWGRVWIYDVDPTGFQRLTDVNGRNEWFTDANGNFTSGLILNYDPEDGGGLDIAVFIFTWNWATVVINGTGLIYNFGIGIWYNCPDGYHVDFSSLGVPSNQIGAWIIFSYHCGIAAGWNYLNTSVDYETPTVTGRWPYGNWPVYWTNGTIDLPGWACWWPDIILHEYGHHVMNSLYGYIPTPPGGPPPEHYINETSNNVTAWSEGWAHFFPLVVFNDPVLEDPWSSTNLEIPHWCSPGWDDGDEVEGRVAGALWDIFDSQNDNSPWYYDSFSDGFSHIWHLLSTQTDNTFNEFWQAWAAHNESGTPGYPKQPALMAIFQNSIDYRGAGDANGDSKVDIVDLTLVIQNMPSYKGQPNWDKRCDLNNDDVCDLIDEIIVISNYRKVYDC
jgi:hypothetical protein